MKSSDLFLLGGYICGIIRAIHDLKESLNTREDNDEK